jgi:predicted MFS family arabinose efflux permease
VRGVRPTYALILAVTAAEMAFVPLLPALRDSLGLSDVAAATLLALTSGMMLLFSIPVGLLVERSGAKRVLMVGGVLLVVACVALALARDFATLFAARAALGVAFAIVWTAGPVRLAASERPAHAMGRLIVMGGLGGLVAPVFGGVVADEFGPRVPFALLAVASVPVAALFVVDRGRDAATAAALHTHEAIALVRASRRVRVAVGGIVVLGVVTGATSLLVPLRLDENGLSSGPIGAILSASAIVWIMAAALTGRVREDRATPVLVGAGLVVLGATWFLPALAVSTPVLVAFLILSSACRAVLNPFIYLLGRPADGTAGYGAALGLMNVAYAAAGMLAPLAAGALAHTAEGRVVFAAVALLCTAIGLWAVRAPAGVAGCGAAAGVRPYDGAHVHGPAHRG